MSLGFPTINSDEDVPLMHPPLEEVICQIRIPPILKIETEIPSAFQDAIRRRFPKYQKEGHPDFRIEIGGAASAEAKVELVPGGHRFNSADDACTVTLSRNFFAVVTKDYKDWESFAEDIALVTGAFQEFYDPAYVSRVGLRYINRLTYSNTETSNLGELISFPVKEATAMMNTEKWGNPEFSQSETLFTSDQQTLKVRLRLEREPEDAIILDFDVFETGELKVSDVLPRTNLFHDVIYTAFRWCIPFERLHVFGIQKESAGG